MDTHTKSATCFSMTKEKKPSLPGSLLLGSVMISISLTAMADVKSLTSSELTQTYIKNSTVIITPKVVKKQPEKNKNRTLTSLTISPGKAAISPSEKQYEFSKTNSADQSQIKSAVANANVQNREAAFSINRTALASVQPAVPAVTFQNARVGGVPGLIIPKGNFKLDFLGNQLGLSRNNDKLTFSIGNVPGISAINMPRPINENGIKLQPRQGGGFDLTFTVPK